MRSIGHLIVFAGPPACGKCTVLRALRNGALPELARRLGLEGPARLTVASARELDNLPEGAIERLLLHYDLLRQRKNPGLGESYKSDPSLAIINHARETTLVTIWTPIEALRARVAKRGNSLRELFERWRGKGPSPGARKLAVVRETYRNPDEVVACYRQWFEFCKAHNHSTHWVLDTSVWEPRLTPLTQWTPPWEGVAQAR